jgi:hypothetical protein
MSSVVVVAVGCKAAPRQPVEVGVPLTSATVAPKAPAGLGSASKPLASTAISTPAASRAHCLRPPYSLEPADTPIVGGFQLSRCAAEDAAVILVRNSGQDKNLPSLQRVADHLDKLVPRDPPGRIPVRVGPCCDKPGSPECVRLDLTLCTMTMEQVATLFARALSELSLESQNIGLRVRLHGMTGPRCSATDASCGPIARFWGPEDVRLGTFALPYEPTAPRRVADSEPTGGACQYDGECVEGCVAWYRTGVPVVTSHGQRLSNDEYCGCIEGQCRAFTSARRSVVLDATLYTTKQGQRQAVDALPLLYGFGDPNQTAKLRQERLQRQLTRCYLGHEAELPRAFDVAFTIPAQGGSTRLELTNAKSPAERCASEALKRLTLPAPPSHKLMPVTGQFSLRLAEPP